MSKTNTEETVAIDAVIIENEPSKFRTTVNNALAKTKKVLPWIAVGASTLAVGFVLGVLKVHENDETVEEQEGPSDETVDDSSNESN